MKKYFALAAALIVVSAGWYVYADRLPASPTQRESVTASIPIKLFFYNPALDQGPGGVACTERGLVGVVRSVPATSTPLADSVQLLLQGSLSQDERASGVESEFPLAGVSLTSATITDGVATLTFVDPQGKTSGGSCRVAILVKQIEATAKQFPSVTSVRILPEDLFQP